MSSLISHNFGVMSEKETMIWANSRGGPHAWVIQAGQVGEMLKDVDAFAEKEGVTEQSAMMLVVQALEDSESEEKTLEKAGMLLLWAACRCPAGKIAEEAARKGGKSVGFEISHTSHGSFYYALQVGDGFVPNFRSLLGVPAAGRA